MVIITLSALILGVIVGLNIDNQIINFLVLHKYVALYALLFFVGISVGAHKGIIEKVKEYHFKIFIIPIGTIVATLIGGLVCSLITKHNVSESLAVVSALGWYSLAGVTITDLAGAELGSIAFMSSFMREIFSFMMIPFIAKHFNYITCIAPAGATSEDTSLPMLIRHTDEETAVLAVFNGIICSAAVPLLIVLSLSLG